MMNHQHSLAIVQPKELGIMLFPLFVEINNFNLTIVAGKFDENDNFKLLEKIIFPHEVVKQNKFTNVFKKSSHVSSQKKNNSPSNENIGKICKRTTLRYLAARNFMLLGTDFCH